MGQAHRVRGAPQAGGRARGAFHGSGAVRLGAPQEGASRQGRSMGVALRASFLFLFMIRRLRLIAWFYSESWNDLLLYCEVHQNSHTILLPPTTLFLRVSTAQLVLLVVSLLGCFHLDSPEFIPPVGIICSDPFSLSLGFAIDSRGCTPSG